MKEGSKKKQSFETSTQPVAASAGVHTWLILTKAKRVLESFAYRSIDSLGICPTDFSVLELLLHKGPLPINTVGKTVFITSGSITTAVDRLESMKLVKRHDDPSDRRVRIVALTEQGEQLIRERFNEHVNHMNLAFSALNNNEIEELQSLLRKLGKGAQSILQSMV
jgi:MarR family 2-MHQ and catechol resistance regulon transcriptional repressor